ncbi:hypothetical protein ACLEPN_16530 [Myxococcus sp. 1LA]
MGAAWPCWDAARNIAPGQHLLKDVSALEEMLAAAHPESFWPRHCAPCEYGR